MTKKLLGLLLSAIILPMALSAQSGKLAGKVTDSKTGEALALANVLIEGTTFGAATNEDGEYVILNVPPGSYTVKARYLGYADQAIAGIVVNSGLTKTVNFKLTSSEVTTDVVVVTAERPLINPNVTNSTAIKTAEDIENLPVRGVNNIVALQGGLVSTGGNIYVRGGRADETAFIVEGQNVTGALGGGSRLSLIDNAIEEIQVQTGGHGAEYGGANGGVVATTMKTGGSTYKFGAEFLTDGFSVNDESTILGLSGFSRGYSEAVGSISGPIPVIPNLTFYVASRYQQREAPAEYWKGMNFKDLDVFNRSKTYNFLADSTFRDSIDAFYPKYRLDSERSQFDINGNLSFNLSPFNLKYSIALTNTNFKNGSGLGNIFNRNKVQENNNLVQSHTLKLSQTIDETMFYTLTGSFFSDVQKGYDPVFKDNVVAYGDPDQNSFYVYTDTAKTAASIRPRQENYSAIAGVASFNVSGATIANYVKTSVTSFAFKGDVVKQFGRVHELKAGFEYSNFVIRNINYSPTNLKRQLGDTTLQSLSKEKQLLKLAKELSANAYGYDIYGNEVDGGPAGAKKPVFAAVHISDKLEYQDLILNVGLRYDYIDNQSFDFALGKSVYNSSSDGLGYISEQSLKTKDPVSYVSPRIGLSLPVTDKTTFSANYGRYVQQSNLNDIYLGWAFMSRILLSGGNAFSTPIAFGLDPMRTTSYEVGFKQQITENTAFNLTAFYNNKEGQVQLRTISSVRDGAISSYYALQNGDYSTTSGIQLAITQRRSNRIQSNINYTYSDARGTGSSSNSQFRTVWLQGTQPFFPNYENSLAYNQAHSGSVEVDYRFATNDGPEVAGIRILENFGVNILYRFNSGHPFTRFIGYGSTSSIPTEPVNSSSTPWVNEINLKIDKSFKVSDFNLNAYVRVENLLNTQNILNVFGQTGDPDDDGYTRTDAGISQREVNQYTKKWFEPLYNAFNNDNNPGFFNSPRTITLGLKLDF